MFEKICAIFIICIGVFGLIFIAIKTVQCNQKSNKIEKIDANKCNIDLSDIYSELNTLYNEITNMDLKYSQTQKLISYVYNIEHILHRLEDKNDD